MEILSFAQIRARVRILYYDISEVRCPALSSELIIFNKYGLNHLIRKGRKHRSQAEICRRAGLLHYVRETISTAVSITEYRTEYRLYSRVISVAHFWSVNKRHGNRKITVVIRQLNSGPKHFFSVMDEPIK